MTPSEQLEFDQLKQELRQTQALLEQEKGKRVAVERDSYETKRQAKLVEEQAAAYRAETDKALEEGAVQMKIAVSVSQGIYALGQMGRAYMARKVSAARIVHRENENCLLIEQILQALEKGDQVGLKNLSDKARGVISTIRGDGEVARMAAAEAALSYGIKEFAKTFDRLVSEKNHGHSTAKDQIALCSQ
jgi:hypothetical protein